MSTLNTIGLAHRARKVTIGTDLTIEGIRAGKIYLVFLAVDASPATQKKIRDKALFYKIPVMDTCSSEALSSALGKHDIKVIGIADQGFSQSLMNEKRK